jgi:hypothetical protein
MQKVVSLSIEARKAAQDELAADLQLTAALGYHSQALDDQAKALSAQYVIHGDLIKQTQIRLANYVKDEEAVKRLTPAIIDLAKATGMDMVQAANLVARGIDSDTGELGRFKIQVDGAAGSAERIDSVITGLNAKFGGQAAAAAGAADDIDRLALGWHNLLEEMGKAFRPQTQDEYMVWYKKRYEDLLNQFLDNPGLTKEVQEKAKADLDEMARNIDAYEATQNAKRVTARMKTYEEQKQIELEAKAKADKKSGGRIRKIRGGQRRRGHKKRG